MEDQGPLHHGGEGVGGTQYEQECYTVSLHIDILKMKIMMYSYLLKHNFKTVPYMVLRHKFILLRKHSK